MNKFILLFQKGVYPMNTWMTGKIITRKKDFYSHLNIEDITDAGYTHADRKSLKNFEIKKIN